MNVLRHSVDEASVAQIEEHLRLCDASFLPRLSERVHLTDYAGKIHNSAIRFEAWANDTLIGMVATYLNDPERRFAHITSVSVLPQWTGRGIASDLLVRCMVHAAGLQFVRVTLEVSALNARAIGLYSRLGFVSERAGAPVQLMRIDLPGDGGERHA
ncbi:MAG: GNAT family N-acetyltransferase [Ideonella sp.]|nr:GNAT family N-acetyltransferase [Ideonella sp.]MCC7456897.1 GNAT family N-acetyltransferase [Nitrospira sp.]